MKAAKISIRGFGSFEEKTEIVFGEDTEVLRGLTAGQRADFVNALAFLSGYPVPGQGGETSVTGETLYTGPLGGDGEISVVIDRRREEGPSPEDLTFTGKLYASGRAEYFVNGVSRGQEQFHGLFDRYGTGVYGFSLLDRHILADLLGCRPGSLRGLLRVLSGSGALETDIREKERRLEEARRDFDYTDRVYRETEEKRRRLSEEALRVKDCETLREQYRVNEINIRLRRVQQLESQIDQLQIASEDLARRVSTLSGETARADTAIQAGMARLLAVDEETADSQEELGRFQESIAGEREKAQEIRDQISRIRELLLFYDERKRAGKQEIEDLVREVFERESDVTELDRGGKEDRDRLRELESELQSSRERCGAVEKEYVSWNDRLIETRTDLSLSELREEEQKNLAGQVEAGLRFAEGELAEIKTASLEYALQEEKKMYREAAGARSSAELRLRTLEEKKDGLCARLGKTRSSLETMERLLAEAGARADLLEILDGEYDGYDESVTGVLRSASAEGIYGAVGESIRVARGYEKVIEAALGRNLQDVLCRDPASARAALRLVRGKKGGWIRLLPVETIQWKKSRIPESIRGLEGYVGAALDFVSYDPRLRKACERLLGNTVILRDARDLPSGADAEGLRFVTMDGDVFDEDGAVEGGAEKSGYSSVTERKVRIREIRAECLRLSREQKSLQQERQQLSMEIDAASDDVRIAEEQLAEAAQRLDSARYRMDFLSSELQGENRRGQRIRTEADRLRTEAVRLEPISVETREKTERIRLELENIHRNMEPLYTAAREADAEIHQLEASVKTSRKTLAEKESRGIALQTEIGALRRSIQLAEERIRGWTALEEEKNMDLVSWKTELASKEAKIRSMEEDYRNRADRVRQKNTEKAEIVAALQKSMTDRDVSLQTARRLEAEREAADARSEYCEEEIDSVKKSIWDDFELHYGEALRERRQVFPLSEGIRESERIRNSLKTLGDVNLGAVEELKKTEEEAKKRFGERTELNRRIGELELEILEKKQQYAALFRGAFERLNQALQTRPADGTPDRQISLISRRREEPESSELHVLVRHADRADARMEHLPEAERRQVLFSLLRAIAQAGGAALYVIADLDAVTSAEEADAFAASLSGVQPGRILFLETE